MEDSSFQETDYHTTINYPMYVPPYSPSFDHPQPDPYQVQASFQMLGSPYTDSPVYAGTPCGQINLSPQQTMFPFNTFPMEATPDQSAPMKPQDYSRSPTTFYATSMEHSTSQITASESFALHTSPPEVSEIPTDYSAFDDYHIDYNQNTTQVDTNSVNTGYSNTGTNQTSFQTYDNGNNEIYSQNYHASHHNTSTSNNGMYMQPQYPANNQPPLEGTHLPLLECI